MYTEPCACWAWSGNIVKSFLSYFSFYPYIMLVRQDPFDNSALELKGYPV